MAEKRRLGLPLQAQLHQAYYIYGFARVTSCLLTERPLLAESSSSSILTAKSAAAWALRLLKR